MVSFADSTVEALHTKFSVNLFYAAEIVRFLVPRICKGLDSVHHQLPDPVGPLRQGDRRGWRLHDRVSFVAPSRPRRAGWTRRSSGIK